MGPRRMILTDSADWDLANLSNEEKNVLMGSPFVIMLALCWHCEFWASSDAFFAHVTAADETYLLFKYVGLFFYDFFYDFF